MEKKKRKKLKLRIKPLIIILAIFLMSFLTYNYINKLDTKHIYITGNDIVKDIDIIKIAELENYPKLYKINKKKITKDIKSLPLIEDVSISRNIFGKLTIKVKETKILFYYNYNNKYITSTGNSIDDSNNYYGYATLLNFTPDTIFDELVNGLNKVDYNIIRMIDRIEYNPYKSQDGNIIDDTRFTLTMNDTNEVIIDTVNIRKLNDYLDIYASLSMDETKGTLYLDTITEDNIYFKSFDTQKAEEEARIKAEEEAKEKEEHANDETTEVIAH